MKSADSDVAKQLLSYARQQWRLFIFALILFMLGAAVEPAIPALFKKLLDTGFKEGISYPLWTVPLIIMGLFLVRGTLNFCATYVAQSSIGRIVLKLRLDLMSALLKARSDLFANLSPGQVVNKVVNDPTAASQILGNVLIEVVKEFTTLICLVAYLFYLNWQLTLLAFVSMPLVGVVVSVAKRRLSAVGQAQYNSHLKLVNIVEDNARAWRVVRTFGASQFEEERFAGEAHRFRRIWMKQIATGALITPVTQLVAAIGVSIIITLALYQAGKGGTTVGEFVSFITALLMTISPMRHLSNIMQPVASALVSARGAFILLSAPAEDDSGERELHECTGDIKFKELTVEFDGASAPSLDRFDLHVTPGQVVALVGASGAGKTTVVNAMLRFNGMQGGDILLDDVSITELRLKSLRQHFAVVSQDIILFDGSVAQNVAYADNEGIDMARVESCLKAANLWDHVQKLPQGMDNPIGVNGSMLSGGQRQRLAIARALYKNAAIWIFDEATSALDTESESVVQQSIESLRHSKTMILIAHRLSTVRNADLICVMSGGRIVERGNHESLMDQQGLYANMVTMQT
ncbi:MAG: hypothetical protein RLZ63_1665 [Pseudomonadota bacterium]|jgi:subfamily B ATP-binding cassette protein MsbA